MLDPETKDGRIIFVLPWEGHTIAGTTDRKCAVTFQPEGTKEEIDFIMSELQKYLNDDVEGEPYPPKNSPPPLKKSKLVQQDLIPYEQMSLQPCSS